MVEKDRKNGKNSTKIHTKDVVETSDSRFSSDYDRITLFFDADRKILEVFFVRKKGGVYHIEKHVFRNVKQTAYRNVAHFLERERWKDFWEYLSTLELACVTRVL